MKILLNDYSGHPFPFELSQYLSKKFNVIHTYANYFHFYELQTKLKELTVYIPM